MNSVGLCSKLEDATYLILASTEDEIFSVGTGVCFNPNGDLLTAAHVVTGRLPVRREDLEDPNFRIHAKGKTGKFIEYIPVSVGLTLNIEYLRSPLIVDLALLRPLVPISEQPFLSLAHNLSPVGTQVLMAGFSDEMQLPLAFDNFLDYKQPEVQAQLQNISIARQGLLMIKSGMIGRRDKIRIAGPQEGLSGAVYWIDNALHRGASGGPVTNAEGEVVGILTKRAVTPLGTGDAPDLKVPAGSNVAISPVFILDYLHKFKRAGMITSWLQHSHEDWVTNDIAYHFGVMNVSGVSVEAAKHTDKTIELRVFGALGGDFKFRHPIPKCDERGLFVKIIWQNSEIQLFLNGELVEKVALADLDVLA